MSVSVSEESLSETSLSKESQSEPSLSEISQPEESAQSLINLLYASLSEESLSDCPVHYCSNEVHSRCLSRHLTRRCRRLLRKRAKHRYLVALEQHRKQDKVGLFAPRTYCSCLEGEQRDPLLEQSLR